MQVNVQKLTRTTLPRKSAAVRGAEFNHVIAPPNGGNSPSRGNWATAGVVGCSTGLSLAETTIETPRALANVATRRIRLVFMMTFSPSLDGREDGRHEQFALDVRCALLAPQVWCPT